MSQSAASLTTPAASFATTADLSETPAPTTVKITPRQAAQARAEARRAAMMSTVAAKSFQSPTLTTAPVATSSSAASSLLAHDLALQSLTSGTAGTAT